MLLGAIVIFPPTVYGSEAEIHVTIGPDGIEIFSNLPRAPLPRTGTPALPAQGPVTFVVAQPAHLPEESSRQGGDVEAPGKSFMHND